jgi:hypothetical protein
MMSAYRVCVVEELVELIRVSGDQLLTHGEKKMLLSRML